MQNVALIDQRKCMATYRLRMRMSLSQQPVQFHVVASCVHLHFILDVDSVFMD